MGVKLNLMCGRYVLKTDPKLVVSLLDIVGAHGTGTQLGDLTAPLIAPSEVLWNPNYNVAPTHQVPAVFINDGQREIAAFSWGLVPSWAKDASGAARLINARSETAAEKPSFRSAMKKRRCVIPADGWYEWFRPEKGAKVAHYFSSSDESLLLFAGLYESWQAPDGSMLHTICLLTTQAAPEFTHVHDRMPVLVPLDNLDLWLVEAELDTLVASSGDGITVWPVSPAVGSVTNNNPDLLTKVPAEYSDTLFS